MKNIINSKQLYDKYKLNVYVNNFLIIKTTRLQIHETKFFSKNAFNACFS